MGLLRRLPMLLLATMALASCGGEKFADPEKFYGDLVGAVKRSDGGYMYDMLDSSRRSEIDTLIGLHMANLDKLPPEERPRWDSLRGKPKREIYAQMIASDQGVAEMFGGSYKVLKVDTLVVLTVQHDGQQPNLMYLRPRDGGYNITFPPRTPEPPRQGAQPQQPMQAPGNGGGDTSSAGPDTGVQLK
jgi:hypothetical protein